jgi:hypothetical protein
MYSVIKDGKLPGLCLLMAGAIIDAVSGTAMSSTYQGDMMVVITPAAHTGCTSSKLATLIDDGLMQGNTEGQPAHLKTGGSIYTRMCRYMLSYIDNTRSTLTWWIISPCV